MVMVNKTVVALLTEDPMVEIAVRHLLGAEHLAIDVRVSTTLEILGRGPSWIGIDITLADVRRPEDLEHLETVRKLIPGSALLCWSSAELLAVADLRRRCDGVISRFASSTELVDALLQVSPGQGARRTPRESQEITVSLTYREGQLLALLGRGHTNKEIAACLGITAGTVKVYLSTLFKKTGAKDRFELTIFGVKNSLFGVAEVSAPIPVAIAARRAISHPLLKSMRIVQPALASAVQAGSAR